MKQVTEDWRMIKSLMVSMVSFTFSEVLSSKSLVSDLQRFIFVLSGSWRWTGVLTSITGFCLCLSSSIAAESGDKPPSFESQILPIFESKCTACHGANSPQQGLDLRSRAAIIK